MFKKSNKEMKNLNGFYGLMFVGIAFCILAFLNGFNW